MKTTTKVLFVVILLLNTALVYGNQDKPVTARAQHWDAVLYSGNRPAKGNIVNTLKNERGKDIKVLEMTVDKGIPVGDFKLYDKKGNLLIYGKGEWKKGFFHGKMNINISELKVKGEAQGQFKIKVEKLFNFYGNYEDALKIAISLYDGNYKMKGKGKDNFLREYISGMPERGNKKYGNEYYYCDQDGNIKKEIYKKGRLTEEFLFSNIRNNNKNSEVFEVKGGELNPFDGIYKHYGENGVVIEEGTYKNGKREGKFFTYDELGKIEKEENYKDGLLDGDYIEYDNLEDDNKKTCIFYDTNPEYQIFGRYISKKGQYKCGKKNGTFITFDHMDIICKKENYKDGKLDGKFLEFGITENPNAYLLVDPTDAVRLNVVGEYKDGKKEGKWLYYDDNIIEKEENYKNGLFDGEVLEYRIIETGEGIDGSYLLKKHEYKEGKLDGEYFCYTPVYEENDEDDEYERHYLSEKGYYKDNKKDGQFITYSAENVLEKEENYKNDKLNGKCRYYSQDGTLQVEREYKNGCRVGLEIEYYPNGNKRHIVEYSERSVPVSKIEYNEDGTTR